MEASEETKQVLEWVRTEIIAGSVLFPKSEEDLVWNNAINRSINIIKKYKEGKGLFQLTPAR